MKELVVEKKTDGQTYNRTKSDQDSVRYKQKTEPDFVGSGYHPPERFVPLLAKFSHPANATQKVQLFAQLQTHYGNRYVQRVVDAYRSQNTEEEESRLASEIISEKGSGRALEPSNLAVQRLIKPDVIQAKPKIGQPNDIYEQEADRVAEQVMRMPEPKVQRQAEEEEKEEEEEEILQTKENPGLTPGVIPDLEARIQSLKGGGQPLPEANREFMERRFGIDFSGVRLHTDSDAAQMSRELNAEAFTYGRDIYFGAERYFPGTLSGKRLLAHELTHVVQQTSNTTIVPRSYVQLSPTPTGEEERTEQGPLQALSCPCGESTRVNYDSLTFDFIMSLAPTIQPIARSEGIPIDPVAGAIADEYDRRRGYRTIVDGAQDAIIDALPECFIDVDRFFDIQNRLLNTLENDVGPANINVRTALELVRRGELQVPGSPPTNIQVNRIIDFLLTERGTVQATAAVISRAQRLFGPYLVGYPDYLSESILVEYFKQGDSYYDRFRRTREATTGHQPCPGDGGCRFIYNRDRIQDALSRGIIRQAIMEPTLPIV